MRIVQLLDQGMGGEVRTPFFADMIAWLDVLPHSLRVFLRRWSGIDDVVTGDEELVKAAAVRKPGAATKTALSDSSDLESDASSDGE